MADSSALPTATGIAEFDLTVSGTQTKTIVLPDGSEETIGIEVLPATRSTDYQDLGNGYGDFHAFWYAGTINMSFYIRVDAYAISYCYDKYAWAPEMIGPIPALTIENYDYTWNSNWAKMWVDYKSTLTGTGKQTKDINAYVEGTRIKYVYAVYDR